MKHKDTLTKSKTALLVIDVQDKFAPVIPEFDNLVTNVTRLVLTFEMFNMPIVVTEQYPEGLGNTVEKLEEQFTVLEVVEKMELAATDNPQFMEKVNKLGCDTFVVCGVETHVCVNQTVLGLIALGKTVHVVADAVGSRHALDHDTGIRKMENAGAIVTTAETVMFELADKAGTDSFKNIQTMVKASKMKAGHAAAKPAKKAAQQKIEAEKKTEVAGSKPAPAAVPAKETAPVPAANAYDDVADLFELAPAAGKAEEEPVAQAGPAPSAAKPLTVEKPEEEVDLVDLELAAAANADKADEKKTKRPAASTEEETKPLDIPKPQESKPADRPSGAAKGVTRSSADVDGQDEADLDDMLATLDKKLDAGEPVGNLRQGEEVDNDIADLAEIIKVEKETEKDPPLDLK
jgi:nicotinamidase-related amidase